MEDDGEHVLRPGDSACWPAGVANAHAVADHSDLPCTYPICGTRLPRDVVHDPDLRQTLVIEGADWRIHGADRAPLREGVEGVERSLGDWLVKFESGRAARTK